MSFGTGTALTSPLGRTKLKQQSQWELNSLGRIELNLQPDCAAIVPKGIPTYQLLHELGSLRREAVTPEYSWCCRCCLTLTCSVHTHTCVHTHTNPYAWRKLDKANQNGLFKILSRGTVISGKKNLKKNQKVPKMNEKCKCQQDGRIKG